MKDYSCSTWKSDTSKIFSFSLHFFWSTRLQLRQERKLSQRQILFQLKSRGDRRINPLPCSVQAVHPTAAGGNAARWGIPPADLQGQGRPTVVSPVMPAGYMSPVMYYSGAAWDAPYPGINPTLAQNAPPMYSSGAWKSYARAQILWASPWRRHREGGKEPLQSCPLEWELLVHVPVPEGCGVRGSEPSLHPPSSNQAWCIICYLT